jgi:hypothetical protein
MGGDIAARPDIGKANRLAIHPATRPRDPDQQVRRVADEKPVP